ncbi:hypothetical protein V1264_008783 [Littorina saxatilis]|uniref:Uncharacterized protein n=2 Tax=Littorina saxatilis TaxID=31220 RepID=A0AAN9G378_9CAEN
MTLPVLHTLSDFDVFVDFKDALALSEGVSGDGFHPWLGLTHDGSNTTDPDNFVWTDGQTLTYLTAFHGDLAADVINANASVNASEIVCVRLILDRMKIGNCMWRRDTICQGSLDSTASNLPHFYIAANRVNGSTSVSTQFVQATSDSQLPGSLGMRSLATPPTDVIDCFQLCATMTSCSMVAMLRDKTSCYVQVD